jgi:uncharacterized protein YcbK (DUF882 family)
MITNLPVLTKGDKGASVKALQKTLLKAGEKLPKFGADGHFGNETESAVKSFQKFHKLKVDGISGPNTYRELKFYQYPNFRKSEFACKCGKYCNGYPVDVDEKLLVLLQRIRDHFGKAVVITSAVRCKAHNKNVGGVSNSQHLYGTAADIKVSGVSPNTLFAYADKINPNGGVGKYSWGIHVDTRKGKSRW